MSERPRNIQPLVKDIRRVPKDQLGTTIRSQLDEASSANPCDIDRAGLLGSKAWELDRSVVEREVFDFVSQSPSPEKTEVAAWFLSALWAQKCSPDRKLVALLTDLSKDATQPDETREALVLAMAAAHGSSDSPDLQQEVHDALEALVSSTGWRSNQNVVSNALARVLGS